MPAPLPLISANQFNETTNPEAPSEEGAGETEGVASQFQICTEVAIDTADLHCNSLRLRPLDESTSLQEGGFGFFVTVTCCHTCFV